MGPSFFFKKKVAKSYVSKFWGPRNFWGVGYRPDPPAWAWWQLSRCNDPPPPHPISLTLLLLPSFSFPFTVTFILSHLFYPSLSNSLRQPIFSLYTIATLISLLNTHTSSLSHNHTTLVLGYFTSRVLSMLAALTPQHVAFLSLPSGVIILWKIG